MHLPLLRALDPYARGHAAARERKPETGSFEAFVVATVLDKPRGRRRFPDDGGEASEPDDDDPDERNLNARDSGASAFEPNFAWDEAADIDDALMPEDAYDAQDLCALLARTADSRD
jgi:hypothetical protein